MKLIEMAGMIPGIEVRRQRIDKNEAVSITGPYKLIAYALKFALYTGLVAIEQIARFGIKQDGTKCHLVLFQYPEVEFDKKQETAPIGVIDGYSYAHMVAAMKAGVNIAVFDNGFNHTTSTVGKAFGKFASAIFSDGKVYGSDTNVLLLLGRSVKDRVLVASQWGKQNPLRIVAQALTGNIRYATVQNHTVLVAAYNTNCLAVLDVDKIVENFKTGTTPVWQSRFTNEDLRIEDITPSIGDSATVAITVSSASKKRDKRKLLLGHAVWTTNKDGEPDFRLVIDTKYDSDLPADSAPVTRLTATTVTAVDGNGGKAPRLKIANFDGFDKINADKLGTLASAAVSGRAYQAAITAASAVASAA